MGEGDFNKREVEMKKISIGILLLGIITIISLVFQGCCAFKTTAKRSAVTSGTYNGYRLIKADWFSINDAYRSRYGRISKKLIIGFCDHSRKEIWYSEGFDDKLLGKFRWYVSNKEHEMKHAVGDDLGENRERIWEFRYAKRFQKLENWIKQ